MKICIISDLHLIYNPRVWKEASALSQAGYQVTVITQWTSGVHLRQDKLLISNLGNNFKYKAALDLRQNSGRYNILILKARRKLSLYLKQFFKIDTKYLLGYKPDAFFAVALRENADLYIAHVEVGLYAGKRLMNKGYKVAFDIEDWYSHDYLIPTRPVSVLRDLEKFALENGTYITCPSHSMASAMSNVYRCKKPDVVYNSFPDEPISTKRKNEDEITKVIWFSQTIGPGRGLEQILEVVEKVAQPVSLTLIGNYAPEYKELLSSYIKEGSKHVLNILDAVSHKELYDIISEHDIGLALEQKHNRSRDTTVTNKILQYLQCGLKVFATETEGQKEIASYFKNAVITVPIDEASEWAEKMTDLIKMSSEKEDVISIYNEKLSWYIQKKKLTQLVSSTI